MIPAFRTRALDLGFVVALAAMAAVPLLLFAAIPALNRPECLVGFVGPFVAIAALWTVAARRREDAAHLPGPDASGPNGGSRRDVWWVLVVAALLAAVTYVAFYAPLRIHFWMGYDDVIHFRPRSLTDWLAQWRGFDAMNRPLTMLPSAVGHALTPGRIDGLLWVGAGLCWLNGLLLFALLGEVLPRARLLAVAAAVLLVIDRSEPSRFFVLWTGDVYWTAVALLLAGVWLFVRSHRLGSRPLLVLSCVLVGGSLLISEAGYPLALLAPVLAGCHRDRRRLPVWTCAWAATLAVLVARFLLYLARGGAASYQATQATEAVRDPQRLLESLGRYVRAGYGCFQTTGAALEYRRPAAWTLALVLALVGFAAWRAAQAPAPPRRRLGLALGISALAFLLGAAPFLHIACPTRTYFFAGPGLAALLSGALCLVGSLLGRRVGGAVVAAGVGLLAANATGENFSAQVRDRAAAWVTFESTVHVLRQIHAVCPQPPPGTLLVLVADDPKRPAFISNANCIGIAHRVLGAIMAEVDLNPGPHFYRDGVGAPSCGLQAREERYDYRQVAAFRVAADGTVSLLPHLPPRLLPADNSADRYNPLALLRPGPVHELPFFRYPRRAERPHDLFDLADGVLLGPGWGPPEYRDGRPSRQVLGEAELVVNSLGQDRRELRLWVHADNPGQLEALDAGGHVVATADVGALGEVRLGLPTDPARSGLLRLRVVDAAGAAQFFRVFGPAAPAPRFPPPPADIVCDENLTLGAGWYSLEAHVDQPVFRWVSNDAEVAMEHPPAAGGELLVDAEPGFGTDQRPCRLTLRDEGGRELAATDLRARGVVRLNLPAGAKAGGVVRLHAEGGGVSLPTAPDILHFRVFGLGLVARRGG